MPTDGSGAAAIRDVIGAYGLGPVEALARPASGTMNEIFLLQIADQRLVLRRHRRAERSAVEYEHRVMAHARDRGIPVPEILPTSGGDCVVERGGRWHSLSEFAPGRQVETAHLTAQHATAMGAMLARIHLALADFPQRAGRRPGPPSTVSGTLQRLERVRAAIESRPAITAQDRDALLCLSGQAAVLRTARSAPASFESGQLVHGDYQHTNLFFDAGPVSAVIDWDKAEVRAPGQEVVRAMDLSLRLQPELCSAFLGGYRSVRALPPDVLEPAAAAYGHQRLHDLWVYEAAYLHGEDRVRRFFDPPPYVPFSRRWDALRFRW